MFDIAEKLHGSGLAGQSFRYVVATGISLGLSFALPFALHEFANLSEDLAVAVGLIAAMVVNFFVVRIYVFQSSGHAGHQMVKFIATTGAFRLGEYILFLILHQIFDLYYLLALLISLTLSFFCKFFVARSYVFK